MRKASRSLIQPKFTVHLQTKSLSEKRSRLSATKLPSLANLVLTLKEVQEVLTADQSTSRKWLRRHLSALKPMDAHTKLDPKTDLRSGFDRFSPENLAANMPVVDLLRRNENMNPVYDFTGQVALVTGASSGIGLATAKAFAKAAAGSFSSISTRTPCAPRPGS